MKHNPFAGQSTRTKIFTVISIVAILLVLALNIWLAKFVTFGNGYIDLTKEGLYTLSPEMEDACEDVFDRIPGKVEMIFCTDRDYLRENVISRVVYYMSLAMDKRFDNFTVDSVNVNIDPTSVAKYKTTSLTDIKPTDVIITYTPDGSTGADARYRIVSLEKFWRIMSDGTIYSYDGEYQMMSYLLSLTLVDRPAAYFVTDHGETYYSETPETELEIDMNRKTGVFVDLLHDRGFEVKTLKLADVKEIPDDCILLIINNPTEDFKYDMSQSSSLSYVSETEILDRYMTDERGSIMVSLDYTKELPNLEDFLAEWGIECTGLKVTDSENSVANFTDGDHSTIIADYDLDDESYAYSIYGTYATMTSAPRFVINNTGSLKTAFGIGQDANEPGSSSTLRIFTPFLYSSKDSEAHNSEGMLAANGKQVLAALGSRQTTDSNSGDLTYSYVFCAATTDFFASDYLGNTSYANFDIVSALVQNICRLDTLADSSLGGGSMNGEKFYGKPLIDASIRAEDEVTDIYNEDGTPGKEVKYGLTAKRRNRIIAVVAVVPVIIGAAGVVVCVKRKYL